MSRGVSVVNLPTGVTPPVESLAGLPVYIGSAPIHMSADKAPRLNEPVLVRTKAEAVAALGYMDAEGTAGSKKFRFTLCEAISAHFVIGNVGPIVLVNVLDPATHRTIVTSEARTIGADGSVKLAVKHPYPASVVVKDVTDVTTYVLGTDYTFAVNSDGEGVLAIIDGGAIDVADVVHVTYNWLNPDAVVASDVIGDVDALTQEKTGMELIAEVFPRFRLVPGQVLAPGFMADPAVTAVALAKASNINGHFNAIVVADIPTDDVAVYTGAAAWKNANSYTDPDLIACWPMGKLGGVLYHLSTLTAARAMRTDADNDGIPYESPSNKSLPIDSIALDDGTEVILSPDAAGSLNDQGIVTALNFVSGWRLWGNRTGAYPGNTDPADAFIPFVRMRAWNKAVLVLSHWQRVDNPMNRRKLEATVDSENIRLNALSGRGFIIGARVYLDPNLNQSTDLLDGKVTYSVAWMPPPPQDEIVFQVEIDPSYLSTLFA